MLHASRVLGEIGIVHYAMDGRPLVEDAAIRYSLDRVASTFTVRAFSTGMLSALGHNPVIAIREFEGIVVFNRDQPDQSKLHLSIEANSLVVAYESSDRDRKEVESRMRDEVLETSRYPEIIYDCARVSASRTGEGQYWMALNGELTLHGVTRAVVVSTRVTVDDNTLRAMGDFSILQSAYGIGPVTALGGAIKLKDELKFSFNLVGRRQD